MLDRTLKAEIKKFLGTGIAREDRVAVNTQIREVAEEMASISRFDKDPLPEYLRRHGRAAVAVCIACTLYERRSRLGNWGVNWAMEVLGLWRWRDADGTLRGVVAGNAHPTAICDWAKSFLRLTWEAA